MDFFDHIRAITNPNYIPPVTDKRGLNWKQPKRENILIDDKNAYMSQADYDLLQEFHSKEHNLPFVGRMFKFNSTDLLWHSADPEPKYFKNNYRKIIITEP